MMHKLLPLLLLVATFNTFAQSAAADRNHWYFGERLGMSFNTGSRVLTGNSKMSGNYGSACVSDNTTGAFLFATNGTQVYDRNFGVMSKTLIPVQVVSSFIVPVPGDKNRYYILVNDNFHNIHYATVNMALRGGLGDVEDKPTFIRSRADHYLTVVKRLYHDGYWLITHTMGSNEFEVFSITANGIDLTPIRSNTGAFTPNSNIIYVHGNMISDRSGTKIIHCSGAFQAGAKTEELRFDKRCGTLTFVRDFFPSIVQQGSNDFSSAAFSSNEKFLYISWYAANAGINSEIYQYDLETLDPNATKKLISSTAWNDFRRLARAPDGIIYASSSEFGAVTSKVSLIHDADLPSATFVHNETDLSTTGDYGFVENWPHFIMDESTDIPGFEMPEPEISGGCAGDTIRFSVKGNFQYDSLLWEFGDGTTSSQRSAEHVYQNPGNYTVTFSWFLCGNKYSRYREVKMVKQPLFNLGKDTTLCSGKQYMLSGPPGLNWLWSNGATTENISVSAPGTYWLRAGAPGCYFTDSVEIKYLLPVLVELGVDRFLCEEEYELAKLDAGEGFETYKWTPTGDTTQWIIVGKTGDYYVIVKDYNGCSGDDGVIVNRRCPIFLLFPNSFSPNGDGLNDNFSPVYLDVVTYRLSVYDRWGAKIFSSEVPADGWNGTIKDRIAPTGTYIYQAEFTGYQQKKLRNFRQAGEVYLIR
jgi:gliding motility-associated-like protein